MATLSKPIILYRKSTIIIELLHFCMSMISGLVGSNQEPPVYTADCSCHTGIGNRWWPCGLGMNRQFT